MRGCLVGSGSEGLQQPEICQCAIRLTEKESCDVNVLYIGTATYDLPGPKNNQTIRFMEAGCKILDIKCAHESDCTSRDDMVKYCEAADIIIVSGGNTLFAVDKWHSCGLTQHLRAAADRGAVLSGGSAGAICWFDGGHSDSADPDSFFAKMTHDAEVACAGRSTTATDESSSAPSCAADVKVWEYIRVPCLGFFPGLVCPHADKVQSNGVLRMTDFDAMMLRHSAERGICIDHFAALVVEGELYSVLSLPGRPGSVLPDGSFSPLQKGMPGIWMKNVVGGHVVTSLVPDSGALADLLRPVSATDIVQDPRLDACRLANPPC
jgi:dipeptidase E